MGAVVIMIICVLASSLVSVGIGKYMKYRRERAEWLEKFQQYKDGEEVRRRILKQQQGQIPYETSSFYLQVAKAVDEYRAGKCKCDGNNCIVCGQVCERPSGDPIQDFFCSTHGEAGLMLWVSAAINEYRAGKKSYGPGKCIACGMAFDPCGEETVDNFCGWHIETGLKLCGYFGWKAKNPEGVAA